MMNYDLQEKKAGVGAIVGGLTGIIAGTLVGAHLGNDVARHILHGKAYDIIGFYVPLVASAAIIGTVGAQIGRIIGGGREYTQLQKNATRHWDDHKF